MSFFLFAARAALLLELAEAVAVTRQTIISLESGRYNASLLLAHKIAKYFDTTIEGRCSARSPAR